MCICRHFFTVVIPRRSIDVVHPQLDSSQQGFLGLLELTAIRGEEEATGGQIILSQRAYEAVKAEVTVEDLGLLAVKGRTATEHAYLLVGLR